MRIPFSLIFLLLVLGEIAVFIRVGEAIGVLATLGLILFGTVAGIMLLRWQGVATLMKARAEMEAGRRPAQPLAHGAVLAIAAILIILPGFITDAIGLLLYIPPVREALLSAFRKLMTIRAASVRTSTTRSPVVDLKPDEYGAQPRHDSPWHRDAGP